MGKIKELTSENLFSLSIAELKKTTPYLDELKLTPRMRKFAWNYALNGFNQRRAIIDAGKKAKKMSTIDVAASQILRISKVKEAVNRILKYYVADIKDNIQKILIDRWIIEATYDPSMFIDERGRANFDVWEDIPEKYRCCVKSIKTKNTKDGSDIEIELVDRHWAQDKLDKFIQMTKETIVQEQGLSDTGRKKLKELLKQQREVTKSEIDEYKKKIKKRREKNGSTKPDSDILRKSV